MNRGFATAPNLLLPINDATINFQKFANHPNRYLQNGQKSVKMPFWVFDGRLRNRALLNNNLKIIFEVSKNWEMSPKKKK